MLIMAAVGGERRATISVDLEGCSPPAAPMTAEDRMAITQIIRYLGHTLDFIEVAKASHGRYQELLKLLRDRPE